MNVNFTYTKPTEYYWQFDIIPSITLEGAKSGYFCITIWWLFWSLCIFEHGEE